jgi:spermidine synthase
MLLLSLFLLSAATLLFELNLTRIFSVAQYYHFAFLVVSLALLGFGASGSVLGLFPAWLRRDIRRRVGWLALGCAASIIGSYLVINSLPFDSYAIAWDTRQLGYLALYLLSLAVPFGFSGLAVGLLLAGRPAEANRTYAVNLVGSSVGCLAILGALPLLGGEGTVVLSAWISLIASALLLVPAAVRARARRASGHRLLAGFTILALVVLSLWLLHPPSFLDLDLSPYKGLYQALLNPDAELVSSRWNAFSRVDVVESTGIRSMPGLSFVYEETFPSQAAVAIDADNLMPITAADGGSDWAAALPEAVAYQLRPGARALILAPGGGLAAATALANGAADLTVAEANPLLVSVVRDDYSAFTNGLYRDPRVSIYTAGPRAFMRQMIGQIPAGPAPFDVVHLALTDPHRTIRSGAYSLAENYVYTVEAFSDALRLLRSDGLLVTTRWLQAPPSETVKLFALALEALDEIGVPAPQDHLVAFRSFQTGTLLIKRSPWTAAEIDLLRRFCEDLRYDLAYYPGMERSEANRYSILHEPLYYDAYMALASAPVREILYRRSDFDIRPPTDDRPFFFSFFKWRQAPQVIHELGKTWQPFGGAGYFILVILLALAVLAAALFILLPVAWPRIVSRYRKRVGSRARAPSSPSVAVTGLGSPRSMLLYFGLLGLGFLLVEIPLIQQFILFLDQPTYAFVAVLFTILLFSGLGSLTAKRWHPAVALGLLVGLAVVYPPLLRAVFSRTLAWPLAARLVLTLPALAPLCLMMGVPFSRGLTLLESSATGLVPWAWAINGSASVIAGILAAMLALSVGFSWVLWLGAAAYAAALLVVRPQRG